MDWNGRGIRPGTLYSLRGGTDSRTSLVSDFEYFGASTPVFLIHCATRETIALGRKEGCWSPVGGDGRGYRDRGGGREGPEVVKGEEH